MLGSYPKTEKAVEHESNSDTNCSWTAWRDTGGIRNQRKNWYHTGHNIKVSKNTQESSGDLGRNTITQTLAKGHQLTMWKTRKKYE